MNWGWLGDLIRPFSSLLNPVAERMGSRLGRRRPRLYIHFNPTQMLWCIARQAQRDGTVVEMMQAMFWADFNHDDEKQTLVITEAYPQGTHPQFGIIEKFAIPPGRMVRQQVAAFVLPTKGKKERPWTGRFVVVDQFQRRYRTKKAAFRWVGPPTPSASPSPPPAH